MTLTPLYQQNLEPIIGAKKATQACLPICFFMLGKAYGYMEDLSIESFSATLDWNAAFDERTGWGRAKMSQLMREQFRVPVVSWWLNAPSPVTAIDLERAKVAGYRSSQREIAWHEANVEKWPLEVIVAAGTPVIATMKPGFGANKSVHAVILASLTHDRYEVIDPDERSRRQYYSIDEIHRQLSPVGAASVILPKVR